MDRWCQNKKCPQKKTQSQIRGSKGAKYYQSHKMSKYYFPCCSMRCREQWFDEHKNTLMQAVGYIDKQILPLDDAWYVEYSYGTYRYNNETNEGGYVNQGWYLMNKLQGIKQSITQEQAQTPEQRSEGHSWTHIDDDQAKQLAVELGLAS